MESSNHISVMTGAACVDEPYVVVTERIQELIRDALDKPTVDKGLKKEIYRYKESPEKTIPFRLVKLLCDAKSDEHPKCYIHEVLEESSLHLPELQLPPRNPELEARVARLRAEQENKQYKDMVKNVDRTMQQKEKFSLGPDVKELNRQLLNVINFLVTVGGAFAFAYKATEYAFGGYDRDRVFVLQLMMGLIFGTIVFFADLYFLIRGM